MLIIIIIIIIQVQRKNDKIIDQIIIALAICSSYSEMFDNRPAIKRTFSKKCKFASRSNVKIGKSQKLQEIIISLYTLREAIKT